MNVKCLSLSLLIFHHIFLNLQSAESTVKSFEDSSVQLKEDFENEDNNRATQLCLHKCELFLHTRVLELKQASYENT